MDIRDEGGLESFKDMLDYWTNEDLDATHDLEYARRFRESFISKRSKLSLVHKSLVDYTRKSYLWSVTVHLILCERAIVRVLRGQYIKVNLGKEFLGGGRQQY